MKRLTQIPFPPYRYVPGREPHPRRSAEGYLYNKTDLQPEPLTSHNWHVHIDYHYAIDLWNHGYDWQVHEALEGIWRMMDRHSAEAWFIQGLIQMAASRLKLNMRQLEPAVELFKEGRRKLRRVNSPYWGIDQQQLINQMEALIRGQREPDIQIQLLPRED